MAYRSALDQAVGGQIDELQAALIALSSDTSTSRKLADSWGLSGFVRPMNQRYDEIAGVLDKAKLEEG